MERSVLTAREAADKSEQRAYDLRTTMAAEVVAVIHGKIDQAVLSGQREISYFLDQADVRAGFFGAKLVNGTASADAAGLLKKLGYRCRVGGGAVNYFLRVRW